MKKYKKYDDFERKFYYGAALVWAVGIPIWDIKPYERKDYDGFKLDWSALMYDPNFYDHCYSYYDDSGRLIISIEY